ncbi:butyrophilin subfamily 3 member A2-like [Trachinotus anak]|uniref:butyrophilin subfamily 3 member A2-like n=1 Tax=Trachinotus anak TaxID=443729 RepID=UPI0039F22DDA
MMEGQSFKSPVRVSVLQHVVVFLLLTHFCGGQTNMTDPSQPVMVMVGDDTVLPCQLEPPQDAVQMTTEWGRLDLNPRFVYVWHNGQELLVDQNTAYKGRASLDINKLKHGDMSLKLSKVKISDNGRYRCYIPDKTKDYFVELLVGAVSSPGIKLAVASSGVVLQCESKGWYPEPEVLWLDGEGKLLPAGPTETVRGPDGLYTVSSRVTVEKRHSNSFTCRVQQKIINQTRETHIHITDDFFMAPSNCAASVTFSVVLSLMFIIAVAFSVWKWRQIKMKNLLQNINEEQGKKSTAANNSTEHQPLMESKDLKKMEELKKKDMKQMIDFLVTLNKDLKKQKEQQTSLMCEAERRAEETEKKVKSVEAEVTAKEGDKTVNKAQGYLKLKEILDEGNLEEIKKGYQELQVNTDRLIKKTCDEIKSAAEKNELEDYLKKIEQQQQDTRQEKQKEQLPVKEQKSEKEESQRKVQPHSGGKEQDKG